MRRLLCVSPGSLSLSDNRQTTLKIVGDRSEADLDGSLGQSEPSHAAQAIASLPGAEDFLDPASDPMDRLVPGIKAGQRFGLIASPHARCHDARRAAFGADGVAKMTALIGAVGKDFARIVRQRIRAGFAVIDIGGRDGNFLHQSNARPIGRGQLL